MCVHTHTSAYTTCGGLLLASSVRLDMHITYTYVYGNAHMPYVYGWTCMHTSHTSMDNIYIGWGGIGKTKKKAKQTRDAISLCVFTKPHHDATSFNSNALIEFPQLVELTQKLCVLEDFSFTNPANMCMCTNTIANCQFCLVKICSNFSSSNLDLDLALQVQPRRRQDDARHCSRGQLGWILPRQVHARRV